MIILSVVIGLAIHVGYTMTHPDKKPIDQSPADYGLAYETVSFLSRDGVTQLAGWVLHPPEAGEVILILGHGYKGNRFEEGCGFFSLAADLLDKKYRILMFDFRYAGESAGSMSTIGIKEQDDMLGAIDYANKHYPTQAIGLLGMSMGAATALLAAAQSEVVIGVVADSSFSDLEAYLTRNLPVWSDLPHVPFTFLIMKTMPLLTGLDLGKASPLSVLDEIAPRPILFIHTRGDEAIPSSESKIMAATDPEYFSLWVTAGNGHVTSYLTDKRTYVERVDRFFSEASTLALKENKKIKTSG